VTSSDRSFSSSLDFTPIAMGTVERHAEGPHNLVQVDRLALRRQRLQAQVVRVAERQDAAPGATVRDAHVERSSLPPGIDPLRLTRCRPANKAGDGEAACEGERREEGPLRHEREWIGRSLWASAQLWLAPD